IGDQYARLAVAQQVRYDGERDAAAADLESPVTLPLEDQDVAEAVADEQVEEARPRPRHDREPGGLVANRDAKGVAEVPVPVPRVDPHFAGIFHEHGKVQRGSESECADDHRDGSIVDA